MSPYSDLAVVEVIPARTNRGDVLSAENLLSSLMAEDLFALEVSGDDNGPHLLVRGTSSTLRHVKNQLRSTYDHVEFRDLAPAADPARAADGCRRATLELTLARPNRFPFRTFEDGVFESADPIRGILGALKGLSKDERVAAQLILTPAPLDWARKYLPLAQPPQRNSPSGNPPIGTQLIQGLGGCWIFGTGLCGAIGLLLWLGHDLLGAILWWCVAGVFFSTLGALWNHLAHPTPLAPKLAEQKVSRPAYQVCLRLYAYAPTEKRARELIHRLSGAYQQFGSASGNAFQEQPSQFNPQVLAIQSATISQELWDRVMRLNVSELAALWHLPSGENIQTVEHTLARRVLPLRPYRYAHGTLIGHSEAQGERIPIHLASEMLEHNTFMIAKTQKGKSTLMAHLAVAAMESNSALVVIDPHGDLVEAISGLVPERRLPQVRYLNLGDPQRVVGFNFLDVRQNCAEEVIISNIIHAGTEFWDENWGPRMEDALRYALRTLLEANQQLAAQGQDQFTLLDVNALFRWPSFRRRLVTHYVRDQETSAWWKAHYDNLPPSLRMEVISPVVTKIDRLAESTALRNITGQSNSTLNFQEVLQEHGIVLLNAARHRVGPEAAGLMTALFLDSLNYAIRAQTDIADARARSRVMVIIDELQTLEGVNYGDFLAELRKMGGSFVMGTQSLSQLEPEQPQERSGVLSNVDTLFVFDTYTADAKLLSPELDATVDEIDISNLPDHTAYLKTQVGFDRQPIVFVKILPPAQPSASVRGSILAQTERYTVPIVEVVRRRQNFETQWYGRDRQMKGRVSDDDENTDLDYGGANAVGYDPKSPINPKGPARPANGVVPPGETPQTQSNKPPVVPPLGKKDSKGWGKP